MSPTQRCGFEKFRRESSYVKYLSILSFRRSAALSPDFQKLAWSYLDNSVLVVELATCKETVLNTPTKDARGSPVSFSSDRKKVIVSFRTITRPVSHKKGRWQAMDQPVRF